MHFIYPRGNQEMLKKLASIFAGFFWLACTPVFSFSETSTAEFLDMSLYELMNVKVITAGRLSQNISVM